MNAGNTWGISGPDFLARFGVAGLMIAGFSLVLAILRRKGRPRRSTDDDNLSTPEIAQMSNSHGAVTATLYELIEDGWLAPAGEWIVVQSQSARPLRTPLHRALWEALREDPSLTVVQLMRRPDIAREVTTIERRLVDLGLLVPRMERILGRLVSALLLSWFALGVVRLIAGLSRDKPVGLLILMLVPSAFLVVILFQALMYRQTQRGLARGRVFRVNHQELDGAVLNQVGAPLGLAVAVFGPAVLVGARPELLEHFEPTRASYRPVVQWAPWDGASGGGSVPSGGGNSGGGYSGSCGGGGGGCGGGCGG